MVALRPDQLFTPCDVEDFSFTTTAELAPLKHIIGQERAVEAVELGIGVRRPGFNIFAFGPPGAGKRTTIELYLERVARNRPEPDDRCYVYNFEVPHKPRALRLPTGWGTALRRDIIGVLADLVVVLPQVFDSEAYSIQREHEKDVFDTRSADALEAVEKAAKARNLALLKSPDGMVIVPLVDGEPIDRRAFGALPEDEQETFQTAIDETEDELASALRSVRSIQSEARDALTGLQRSVAAEEISERLAPLRERFAKQAKVVQWIDAVSADILDNLDRFLPSDDDTAGRSVPTPERAEHIVLENRDLRRYLVNVIVDGSRTAGAPVVAESFPTLPNLVGRIEQEQRFGALTTDFTLIKPGALHAANGGYLVLEMDDLLQHPLSWEALKRALKVGAIHIEPPADGISTMTTIMLDPEPIPFDAKIILIGDASTYHALLEYDPDFAEWFKVGAEFGRSMPRQPEGSDLYARFIATVSEREMVMPFDRIATARVVEHGSRLAEDSERLTTDFLAISDVIREADYWARVAERETVTGEDVERALSSAERRADLSRERIHDAYERGTLTVALDGTAVGQLNALTVVGHGKFSFGLPVRVSARVRQGGGDVLDIERDVELGGPLHSKGVLILSGFLSGRYLPDEALAIQASITFEQSYSMIDGDSATTTELYALLSAISGLPIRQDLAVTGSMSQAGDVQAIGGVNEKIEGFFDVCEQNGLTGTQGVVIPETNVVHLMLRRDVVEAVENGRFHVHTVSHVDEGLELMFGLPAGVRGDDRRYPEGSVNRAVEDRLDRLAAKRRDADPDKHGSHDSNGGRGRRHPKRNPPSDHPSDTPSDHPSDTPSDHPSDHPSDPVDPGAMGS